MHSRKVVALFLAAAVLAACARQGPISSAGDAAAVRDASDRYRAAINAADTGAFFGLLAENLELLPPGAANIKGSPAHNVFRGMFSH